MYHVNPKTGEIGTCHAKNPKTCPFGSFNHSDNLEDIQMKADIIHKTNKNNELINKQKDVKIAFEYQDLCQSIKLEYEKQIEDLNNEYNIANINEIPREYFEKRGEIVDNIVSDNILIDNFDTSKKYSYYYFDENGDKQNMYNEEREKLHNEILNELKERYQNVLCEGKTAFSVGLSGAGKTTVLKKEIDLEEYVTINSDDIKEIMAEKGLIPKLKGLTSIECCSFIHEESSYLADRFFKQMVEQRKNIIFDSTGSDLNNLEKKLELCHRYGYNNKDSNFVFIDVSIDTAKRRTMDRYIHGIKENMMDSNSLGGRYIKNDVLEKNRSRNSKFNSKNAENFYIISNINQTFKGCKFSHYNNDVDGRPPIKI